MQQQMHWEEPVRCLTTPLLLELQPVGCICERPRIPSSGRVHARLPSTSQDHQQICLRRFSLVSFFYSYTGPNISKCNEYKVDGCHNGIACNDDGTFTHAGFFSRRLSSHKRRVVWLQQYQLLSKKANSCCKGWNSSGCVFCFSLSFSHLQTFVKVAARTNVQGTLNEREFIRTLDLSAV
jgi:hypothetical protein